MYTYKIKLDRVVDGEWKEAGDTGFPWEDDANNGTEAVV